MKKKLITLMLAMVGLFNFLSIASAAAPLIGNPEIAVLVNGRKIDTKDGKPFMDRNQRVLVPLRFVSQELGASLGWDQKLQTATIKLNSKTVKVTVNQNQVLVDGEKVTFDTKAVSKGGRIFIPIRFIIDGFRVHAKWDAANRRVWIGEEKVPKLEESDVKVYPLDEKFTTYFGKRSDYYVRRENVTVFTQRNLPLAFEDEFENKITIYSVELTNQPNGWNFVKVHYSGKHVSIYYLTGDGLPRSRFNSEMYRVKHEDGSFTATFRLQDEGDLYDYKLNDWRSLKPKDIEYMGFGVGLKTLPLMANPFLS